MPVSDDTSQWVEQQFARSIVPTLVRYIEIPNKSPSFDAEWRQAGHMERAVELLAGWAREALPQGATLEIVRLGERTPLIFMDVPATGGASGDTVLLYGHLDKQPEMSGWREGLGPWQPVLEGDKLAVWAWMRSSRTRSFVSRACSGPARTPMAPTNFFTCRPPASSRSA
jgi:acetylornithine deacetylase/succinyl-diaminopimelate desuccinylase-like protein